MLDSFSMYLIGFNIQLFRSNVDSFSIYLIDLTIQLFRRSFSRKKSNLFENVSGDREVFSICA